MESQQNHNNPSLVKPRPHLSTYGVLKESIKTTRRNGRLALSILLFVFLSSSQLELGGFLALRPLLKDLSSIYWPVKDKVTCFEIRAKTLVESPSYPPWTNRIVYYSYQRSNSSSTNGYTAQTKQATDSKGAYSYQRVYPSLYNGYTAQTNQASERKGAYSYQRTNPSSYGYKGQTKQMVNQKGAYTYHHTYPTSHGYMGKTSEKGELKDVRAVLGMYVLILTISCVILLFFLVATISSSYEAYTAKVISLKDVFLKFRESWKRSIHTGIFLTLISLGFFLILVFFTELISFFTKGSSTYVLYAILLIPGYICYVHLASLWMMSFMVSILETDYCGLKAIVIGGELMKGKRHQAYLLIVLFNLANAGVNTISVVYSRKLNKWANMSIAMPFVIGMVRVIKFLMFVTFTIYYHERKINQEEEKAEGRVSVYVPLASDEV